MPVLHLQDFEQLAPRPLRASGANAHHARTVAQSVAQAKSEGIRYVGLAYWPTYLSYLLCQGVAVDTSLLNELEPYAIPANGKRPDV
jgi:LDH2 family malate/lactate/ureidoglycolate dehydrogenase